MAGEFRWLKQLNKLIQKLIDTYYLAIYLTVYICTSFIYFLNLYS